MQLKHEFILKSQWGEFEDDYLNLNSFHHCKFCDVSAEVLFVSCHDYDKIILWGKFPGNKKLQAEYINNFCTIKCITEEEYIIKQIIE